MGPLRAVACTRCGAHLALAYLDHSVGSVACLSVCLRVFCYAVVVVSALLSLRVPTSLLLLAALLTSCFLIAFQFHHLTHCYVTALFLYRPFILHTTLLIAPRADAQIRLYPAVRCS